mmetsp:Transcript_6840/g.5989  ORF Transcript_6840/g.5989 Transcript_6840/m.5989 type:complete len:139 (+) Transcript_6840:3-419(+)
MIQRGVKRVHKEVRKEEDKEKGKMKSRIHRVRKKQYLQDLETENNALKEMVEKLQKRIKLLEAQTESTKESIKGCKSSSTESLGMFTVEEQFKRSEKFLLESVPKMIKETPTQVSYTLMSQAKEAIGLFGRERIAFLK